MAKLGTTKRPAIVHVQTESRAGEIMDECNSKEWQVIVGLEPDKPEDISDLNKLAKKSLVTISPTERFRPLNGNNFCPCGSGKKYKKCCQQKEEK